ncbi:hypothetical protein DKK72_02170 [Bifidobacterium indicum]|nr:hypothetical protein DKK72_02170 [Bifidobacterium indicum]
MGRLCTLVLIRQLKQGQFNLAQKASVTGTAKPMLLTQTESCIFPFELGIDRFAGVQPDGLDIGFYLTVPGDQTVAAWWSQTGVIELVKHLILALFK